MICPHCEKSLLRKERTNNVCTHCLRKFALDPKTNTLRLNDLRVRRIAAKLTQDGRLPSTPGHLWYALSRASIGRTGSAYGCVTAALVFGSLLGVTGLGTHATVIAVAGGLLAAVGVVMLVTAAVAPHTVQGRLRMQRASFREVITAWRRVYGALPPGLVDDEQYPPSPPVQPAGGVILCPDPSVATLLVAHDLPARYGLGIVAGLDAVPAQGPVIVLHDADAHGLLLARRARSAFPGRLVVDAGLTLRAARGPARVVPFRSHRPDKQVMAELAATGGLPPDDLTWLARGWVFPLVGVRPGKLLAGMARVAERVTRAVDPHRRRAADIGFLTWPGESR